MSLLLSRVSKICGRKPVSIRSSLLLLSNGYSSSKLRQTPPCSIIGFDPYGEDMAKIKISYGRVTDWSNITTMMKKVPLDLAQGKGMIGASQGWVATVKPDGRVSLQDDLNPVASETNPKRISLPPFETLPGCQTQIVTNMAMSSASPVEDEDCVVAFKFMGPQLSFCKPAQTNPEWINIKIQNPCFFSSPVMFSKEDGMFRIPGSGGHIIGSWDLHNHNHNNNHNPKIQKVRFETYPELTEAEQKMLDSCCRSEHLVESRTTTGCETFLVKLYKKASKHSKTIRMITKAVLVFKLDKEGNAFYTTYIGDLRIYLSKAEPFVIPASSFPGLHRNSIDLTDADETESFYLPHFDVYGGEYFSYSMKLPYAIPPQNIPPENI